MREVRGGDDVAVPAAPDPLYNTVPTVKKGIEAIAVGFMFITMAWIAMFFFASETTACERSADNRPRCRVGRAWAGIPLRTRDLGVVQTVSLQEQQARPRPNQASGYTYWVRYHTDNGPVDGTTASTKEERADLVAELQGFLADRASTRFELTLPGHWVATRLMPGVFFFGALIVFSGISILIQARRRR